MKLTATFVSLVLAVGLAEASISHAQRDLSIHARHARHRRDEVGVTLERRDAPRRRCQAKTSSGLVSATSSSHHVSASPLQAAASHSPKPTTSSVKPAAPKQSTQAQSSPPANSGLMSVTSKQCGGSGATEGITATSGPNGSEDWLNCGVNAGGWNPPPVTIADVKAKDLSEALLERDSPFAGCTNFIGMFEKYAGEVGIPPIFIASIAMQESSCNQYETGGAGEQGIMQITKDKCGGAPGGDCKNPDFNIRTGTNYFKSLLDANNGNVLLAIGEYNGWQPGLTIGSATEIASHGCCPCQNNLDYLMQFLNGWVQGVDPTSYTPRIGKYFNLDKCHES